MLEVLIDNIFVIFGGRVFQQTMVPFGKVEVITSQIMYGRHHAEMQSRDDMGNNLREKYHYVFFARDVPDMGYQPGGEIMAS
jgi:hypothetical protein